MTSYNRKAKTLQSISKLYLQNDINNINLEIFLVDDASKDGTSNFVKKKFPNVNIIKGNGKLYWGGGTSLAWEEAIKKKNFDYYLWPNDDTYLKKNALNILLSAQNFLKTDRFIVVGSTYDSIKKERSYGGYKSLNNKIRVFKYLEINPNNNFQYIDRFNGNIVLISNNAFLKIGKFNKSLTHNLGDIEYSIRASNKNIPIVLAPNYLGICNHDIKRKNIRDLFYGKTLLKTYFLFTKKYGGIFWFLHFLSAIFAIYKH